MDDRPIPLDGIDLLQTARSVREAVAYYLAAAAAYGAAQAGGAPPAPSADELDIQVDADAVKKAR